MSEAKQYQTTAEQCAKIIHGVCSQCGGELVPIETVDNSGAPTFWAGCEECQRFCWGVSRRLWEIAREMVVRHNLTPYEFEDNPRESKREKEIDWYARYYMESQISGSIDTVQRIIAIHEATP